jgi:hypothetical protein
MLFGSTPLLSACRRRELKLLPGERVHEETEGRDRPRVATKDASGALDGITLARGRPTTGPNTCGVRVQSMLRGYRQRAASKAATCATARCAQLNVDAANRFIQHATGIDVVSAQKAKARDKADGSTPKKAKSKR